MPGEFSAVRLKLRPLGCRPTHDLVGPTRKEGGALAREGASGSIGKCESGQYKKGTPDADSSLAWQAGLSIAGCAGTVYSVQYVTDLAQTNNPLAWRCLEYLQLPASPYLWVAMEPPKNMVFIPPGTFRMGSPANEMVL